MAFPHTHCHEESGSLTQPTWSDLGCFVLVTFVTTSSQVSITVPSIPRGTTPAAHQGSFTWPHSTATCTPDKSDLQRPKQTFHLHYTPVKIPVAFVIKKSYSTDFRILRTWALYCPIRMRHFRNEIKEQDQSQTSVDSRARCFMCVCFCGKLNASFTCCKKGPWVLHSKGCGCLPLLGFLPTAS